MYICPQVCLFVTDDAVGEKILEKILGELIPDIYASQSANGAPKDPPHSKHAAPIYHTSEPPTENTSHCYADADRYFHKH